MSKLVVATVAALAAAAMSGGVASAQPVGCVSTDTVDVGAACALVGASDFGGWGSSHDDNLASPTYYTIVGSAGPGNSHYCVTPGGAANACSPNLLPVTVGSTGWIDLTPVNPALCYGCGHGSHPPGTAGGWISVDGGSEGGEAPLFPPAA